MKKSYPCPCCGYLTLSDQPPGTYEICPVCFWEDDPVQYHDPDYNGGANSASLNEARKHFAKIGASGSFQRPPTAETSGTFPMNNEVDL